MALWIGMFLLNLTYPLVMLFGGWCMEHHCNGAPNSICGYRSKRSMKNRETWAFANADCGRRWNRIGRRMLPVVALIQLPFVQAGDEMIGIVTMAIAIGCTTMMVLSILPTEKALKETFDENGDRKNA